MKRVVTFGEIMLRLKSPGYERLFQSPLLEATFGGGEANVAVSLGILGEESSFVTALPGNPIGDAAVSELRRHGVDVSHIIRSGQGRMGIYFLETGANQRPSQVVYDRSGSVFAVTEAKAYDWESIFSNTGWFHLTGITPAISERAARCALEAIEAARDKGVTVSIDLNYRKKLWSYGKSPQQVMGPLVERAQVIMANEEDIQMSLGFDSDADVGSGSLEDRAYEVLAQKVKSAYPGVQTVAITLRESLSADKNAFRAVMLGPGGFYRSVRYVIDDIVDRVGGGDAFTAGLIFALRRVGEADALQFAVAAACLKHSIPGDFNLASRQEIERLMDGDGSGRVRR